MRVCAGALVAALVLLAAAVAFADIDEGEFPPAGGQETGVWEWDEIDLVWVQLLPEDHRCEAFHVGNPISYYCNGEYVNDGTEGGVAGDVEVGPWKFDVEATVAQYLEARLSKDGLAWYVKKPYKFDPLTSQEIDRDWAADSIDLSVKSNGDIRIDFVGFDDLLSTTDPLETIPSSWFLTQQDPLPPPGDGWWKGDFTYEVDEDPDHPVLNFKLWNRITTGKCTAACLYEDMGAIYFVLEDQKPWVVIKQGLETRPRIDP